MSSHTVILQELTDQERETKMQQRTAHNSRTSFSSLNTEEQAQRFANVSKEKERRGLQIEQLKEQLKEVVASGQNEDERGAGGEEDKAVGNRDKAQLEAALELQQLAAWVDDWFKRNQSTVILLLQAIEEGKIRTLKIVKRATSAILFESRERGCALMSELVRCAIRQLSLLRTRGLIWTRWGLWRREICTCSQGPNSVGKDGGGAGGA